MDWYSKNLPQSPLPAFEPNKRINDPALYKPDPGLQAAVDVALALGQPLLLTGEPGVGKSQLAAHIAWYFELGEPALVPVQTTSVARDLFYRYDALGHFQYNQHEKAALSPVELEKRFIRYQGIGLAIKEKKRRVVLIDEIDKAPRDLPNDVLTALDRMSFEVPEIKEQFTSDHANQPIVIITSNSEKNLPDPFLRRVAYYHIPFPEDRLVDIVGSKVLNLTEEQLDAIIRHFLEFRGDELRLRKKPSTSELLLWADLLIRMKFDPKRLDNKKDLTPQDRSILKKSYSVLAKTQEDLQALYNNLEK